MSRLAQFRALLIRARQDAPAPAPQLTQDRDAAAAELAAAEVGVEEAEAAYNAGLLGSTDEGLRALDDARRAAAIRLDRGKVLVERFAAQAVAAEEARDKAELAKTVEAFTAAQAAFQSAVERDLPEMAARARAILALRAEAERLRKIADRALAEAGEGGPLPGVEAFRALPGRPREELRREVVDLWVDGAGNLAGHQDKIVSGSDGIGTLRLERASHLHRFTKKRPFEVIEHLPAEPSIAPVSLDTALAVPDVYPAARGGDRRPVKETRAYIVPTPRERPARAVEVVEPSRSERRAMDQRA